MITLAGGDGEGYADGKGSNAKFARPHDLVVGDNGVIYITDMFNNRIRACARDGCTCSVLTTIYLGVVTKLAGIVRRDRLMVKAHWLVSIGPPG